MSDPKILNMPVEFGLELMAIVSPDFFDAEGELFDNVIDKVESTDLSMFFVKF